MKKGNKGTAATDQTRIGGRRSRSGLVLFTTNITLRWSWNLAPGGERILPALIPAFSPGAKVPRPPGIANVPLILRDSVPWHDGGKRPPCHRRSSPRSNVRPLFLTPPASGNLQIPGMRENLCSGLFPSRSDNSLVRQPGQSLGIGIFPDCNLTIHVPIAFFADYNLRANRIGQRDFGRRVAAGDGRGQNSGFGRECDSVIGADLGLLISILG